MDFSSAILAVVSTPAPAGRSSAAGVSIIVLCLVAAAAFAVRSAVRHFKGEGGCCGGASAPPPPQEDKAIGPEVARRELALSGLHCMNCVGRVKKALDAIPGVAADVTLEPQRALVRMDREVPDDVLRKAVEELDFKVVSIS